MNKNRILSLVLTVVIMFATVAAVLPVRSYAAHSPSSVVGGKSYTVDELEDIVNASYKYSFDTAEEMLEYELELGYLDHVSSAGNEYTLYINRYTGSVYYVNNFTGEILTSNPYNLSGVASTQNQSKLMSQIEIDFNVIAGVQSGSPYRSSEWAAKKGQISVSRIANGLRVSYTLGDTSQRYLVPGRITAERFFEEIITPLNDRYVALIEEYYGDTLFADRPYNFFEDESQTVYEGKAYNHLALYDYIVSLRSYISRNGKSSEAYVTIDRLGSAYASLLNEYTMVNIDSSSFNPYWAEEELVKQGIPFLIFKKTGILASEQTYSRTIKTYCPEYTLQEMYYDEEECGFEHVAPVKPVFRCALEYTFNADGSLSVRLPANSVSFDESQFNIKQMKVLPYFGAGDLSRDGYVFLPDGSGAVTVFSDFYNSNTKDNASVYLDVYGTDYAYFSLKINKAYTEQVTMPVYGMISTSNANTATEALTGKSETKNGFFAIVEEGSSMSTIALDFQAASFKYGAVYTTFAPYPLDTVPVNGGGLDDTYVKYSNTKFTGSYTTRYVMLSDTDAQEASGSYGYEPTYSGMAHYYREYLKGRGELEALDEINENLPLYIEALGSMEIVKKVLSFPVTTSIPLTTFDNVVTIYDELANAKAKLLKKAEEQEALAEAEDEDLDLKNDYLAKAERYRALADELINVTNVNFKLTGFANGGMYFTYPTKVRWEKACGGKKGFASLMSAASERTAGSAAMGIYPDFDFAFISNTAMFDGISNKNTAVKMLDNRYASKQSYNTISRIWESTVAMVVSPGAFDRLYTKFNKQYSKYGMNTISVSTLGSTLNSNMDEKNALPREEALHSVTALLDRINSDGYGIMLERGNAYSLKYADHIIGVSTDSSYYKFSSYSVPFIGMVLHGYMNYAGTPINYTGDPDYDILRAIENGAALYYILCYQNTGFMKDDELLDDYYGVSYENWFDDIVIHYNRVNSVLAKLQKYEIVNHDVLIAERVIGDDEVLVNNRLLASEFITNAEAALAKLIADTYDEMRKDEANVGVGLMVDVDVAALTAIAADMLDMTESELESSGLNAGLNALAMRYEAEYAGIEGKKSFEVVFDTLSYESQYNYVTDSVATDKDNYDYTDYTVDNRLVTIVTYRDAETGDEVQFILNYNIYAVTIRFEDGTVREIGATSFVPLGLE